MFDLKQEESIKDIIKNYLDSEEFIDYLGNVLSINSQYHRGTYCDSDGSTEITLKWKDTTLSTLYIDDNHGG